MEKRIRSTRPYVKSMLFSGAYYQIEHDAIGRVWKRIDTISNESYHYYTGAKLVQELDDSYAVTTDYLAGTRRYMPGEASGDQYRYYIRDHQGSVVAMTDHAQNLEEYRYDAWGNIIDVGDTPSVVNNIRYGGARMEASIFMFTELIEIYETGARHYWPGLGRFLQRDPLSYQKIPSPTNPLSVNPYMYAENNPVMKKDLTGMAPTGYYRGARMGDTEFILGTIRPPEYMIYDVCGDDSPLLTDDEIDQMSFYKEHREGGPTKRIGLYNIGKWKRETGQEHISLCGLNIRHRQPNDRCPNITYLPKSLLKTYMARCLKGSCPTTDPGPPIIPPKRKWCPNPAAGHEEIHVGFGSTPSEDGFEETGWVSSANFNAQNWQDPFWATLRGKLGGIVFNEFVNKVLPLWDQIYTEIMSTGEIHQGIQACSVFEWDMYERLVLDKRLPKGWKYEQGSSETSPHFWGIIYQELSPEIRFVLDPQRAATPPILRWWFGFYTKSIWGLWKEDIK